MLCLYLSEFDVSNCLGKWKDILSWFFLVSWSCCWILIFVINLWCEVWFVCVNVSGVLRIVGICFICEVKCFVLWNVLRMWLKFFVRCEILILIICIFIWCLVGVISVVGSWSLLLRCWNWFYSLIFKLWLCSIILFVIWCLWMSLFVWWSILLYYLKLMEYIEILLFMRLILR